MIICVLMDKRQNVGPSDAGENTRRDATEFKKS